MENLELILSLVAGLVGFPAIVSAVINALKYFGLPDGYAGILNFWANLLAYVAVGVLVYLGKVDLLPGVDLLLGNVAQFLLAALAFLSSLGVTKAFHAKVLRGLPLVGFSHSLK